MLISFDGTDSSGKETQVKRLVEKLRAEGHVVLHLQTPDYSIPSGQKLFKLFRGLDGSWDDLPWRERMELLAENRAAHREEVLQSLTQDNVVVYDRYIPSSMAHMTIDASKQEGAARDYVHEKIRNHEEVKNNMPREDISIFLDVPPKISCSLNAERRAKTNDVEEQTDGKELQQAIYNEYIALTNSDPSHYKRIVCTENNQLLPIDEIANRVWGVVSENL